MVESIIDNKIKDDSVDVVLNLILDDFLQVFAQTTLSNKTLDDHLICEDVF